MQISRSLVQWFYLALTLVAFSAASGDVYLSRSEAGWATERITYKNGDVWLLGYGFLERLEGPTTVRIDLGPNETAWALEEVNGNLILGTSIGLFHLDESHTLTALLSGEIRAITHARGKIWLAMSSGAKCLVPSGILDTEQCEPLLNDHFVTDLKTVEETLWIASYAGVWKLAPEHDSPVLVTESKVETLFALGDEIWGRALKRNKPMALAGYKYFVLDSSLRLQGEVKFDTAVTALAEVNGVIWVGNPEGEVFRLVRGELQQESYRPLDGRKAPGVQAIMQHGEDVWIGTTNGLYRRRPGKPYNRELWSVDPHAIYAFVEIRREGDSTLWIIEQNNVYSFHSGVEIDIELGALVSFDIGGVEIVLGTEIQGRSLKYTALPDPLKRFPLPGGRVGDCKQRESISTLQDIEVSSWRQDHLFSKLVLCAQDSSGNVFGPYPKRVISIPPLALILLGAAFSIPILFFVRPGLFLHLMSSPKAQSSFWMFLLDLPLALPVARRRLLSKYRNGVATRSRGAAELGLSVPSELMCSLSERTSIGLCVDPGMQYRTTEYISWSLLRENEWQGLGKSLTPVGISMLGAKPAGKHEIREHILASLSELGGIAGEPATKLLDKEAFLFIFAVADPNPEKLDSIRQFAEESWLGNIILVILDYPLDAKWPDHIHANSINETAGQ